MGLCGSKVDEVRSDENKASQPKPLQDADSKTAAILETLEKIPLLKTLNPKDRKTLAGALQERVFKDRAKIIVEGEDGDEFYIIKSGKCRVEKRQKNGSQSLVAMLSPGDYFGEKALISNEKRGASVVAEGDVCCLTLGRAQFRELFGKNKLKVNFVKRQAVSAAVYDPEKELAPKNAKKDKTPEQRAAIRKVVDECVLFKSMDEEQKKTVIDEFWLRDVKDGEKIIRQGDLGDNFYVVESGSFDIFVRMKSEGKRKGKKVAVRGKGTSFGELALMYNHPRAATVVADGPAQVWAITQYAFRKILTTSRARRFEDIARVLNSISLFAPLLTSERMRIAEALSDVTYSDKDIIVKEGARGDTFYILKKGQVDVYKKAENGKQRMVGRMVATPQKAHYFGEKALLGTTNKRAATCVAKGDVECMYLTRKAFSALLGNMKESLEEEAKKYSNLPWEEQLKLRAEIEAKEKKRRLEAGAAGDDEEKKTKSFLRTDIKLKDLKIIGLLGRGSFGRVYLVETKDGKETFALKCVNKMHLVRLGQQEHILSEKRVMEQMNSQFLIRLHATFRDDDNLYFLLEVCLGGELFSVLRSKTFFEEDTARFFAASVICAFEHMHAQDVIYRDLKPENLLLDSRGYLKITDFGFAKQIGDQRTYTLCGTPDYLAPEVVSGKGHGKGVDWWTLGILIFEMLASFPPFYDEDPMQTYARIMAGKVLCPSHVTPRARDLILKLLQLKANKRLGVGRSGASEIKKHAWFKGFDWAAFTSGKMKAPLPVRISNNRDLSNFEVYPDEEGPPLEKYVPDPKNPDWDVEFGPFDDGMVGRVD